MLPWPAQSEPQRTDGVRTHLDCSVVIRQGQGPTSSAPIRRCETSSVTLASPAKKESVTMITSRSDPMAGCICPLLV